MSKEQPSQPNRDAEFKQLIDQMVTPSDLYLATQEYDKARDVFFDRFEDYVAYVLNENIDPTGNHHRVSSIDYKVLMADSIMGIVQAFESDSRDEDDLVESITDFFVNMSEDLAVDMSIVAGNRVEAIGSTADEFREDLVQFSSNEAARKLGLNTRLAMSIIRLHGMAVDAFIAQLKSPDNDQ